MRPRRSALLAAVAVLLLAHTARADRVAVLPSRGPDPAAGAALDADTARALAALGHTVVPEPETRAAVVSSTDGAADSPDELRAVGAATHADWVLSGTVDPAVLSERVELQAALVSTGRVESVAREVDKAKSAAEVQEMLAVLLRPEGIGAGELPWERATPTAPKPAPAPSPSAPAVVMTPPPAAPPAPAPSGPPRAELGYPLGKATVWPPYGAGRPLFVSAELGFSAPIARPAGASGSGAAFTGAARLGYALGATGLELFAEVGGNLVGPRALWVDGGGRFLFAPALHRDADGATRGLPLFLGPEVSVGAFVFLPGPDVTGPGGRVFSGSPGGARPTVTGALDAVLALSPAFQLDAHLGNLRWVPAEGGTLLVAGATVGAALRF
jgi:hypothetical protein